MTRSKATPTPSNVFFLYSRKSTEAEDRQVLSIDSQIDDVKRLAEKLGLAIGEVFTEARSAKAPGRPVFNEMMRRLAAGEAAGILCWKLDRLARNPMDGGSLIWAVKQQGIRIVTPTQTYSHEDDNIILMYIEFGMAHKYIDDLSRVVKRGLQAKAKLGWLPTVAPRGYLNDHRQPKGQTAIIPDPERFPLVRRMWDLMLSGSTTPPKILKIANEEWGFRTRTGKPLCRSGIYRIFTNPFYAGSFEYPAGRGQWFKGNHEPMVTAVEYERVQVLLGSKGRPRPITRTFSYTGLIRCGRCRARITAEEKHQLICAVCRHKFAYHGRDRCPRCETPIKRMPDDTTARKPTFLHYTYYHCTKQKDPACPERVIRVEQLEGQIASYLEKIEMSERFQRWVLERLRRSHEHEVEVRRARTQAQEKAYKASLARLDNLVRLKTAPENVDGSLLSDEEYARQRSDLLQEKRRLEESLTDGGSSSADRIVVLDEVFEFARQARSWLTDEDPETKRLILAVFATEDSNLTLSAKKLRIDAPKPFPILAASRPSVPGARPTFEPEESRMNKREQGAFAPCRLGIRGWRDDVRTYGPKGFQLVRALRQWLETARREELLALQHKLSTLFERVRGRREAA